MVKDGRDVRGRFTSGLSPDRGRGRPAAATDQLLDPELRRIVLATANLPVSIPCGRSRRVVTLYEALIRKLATGHVYRRASLMDFIQLVQASAATRLVSESIDAHTPSAIMVRLEDDLQRLRATATSADATQLDRRAANFYELLLDTVARRSRN